MCVYIYVYIYIEKYGKQWNVISYETAWMQPQASKNSSSDSGKKKQHGCFNDLGKLPKITHLK